MNCCIITRMIKFACMALLFGTCCPSKGDVCELLGFQPYLQQKGIFAGPVWDYGGTTGSDMVATQTIVRPLENVLLECQHRIPE